MEPAHHEIAEAGFGADAPARPVPMMRISICLISPMPTLLPRVDRPALTGMPHEPSHAQPAGLRAQTRELRFEVGSPKSSPRLPASLSGPNCSEYGCCGRS
jgi:hypothetical protein